MSSASEILRRRSRAEYLLESLLEQPGTVSVIHYACESFNDPNSENSPRITVIAIRKMDSGQTDTFSLDHEAELASISASKIRENLDDLERKMLCKFYDHVRMSRSRKWLHWNMRDATYGFNAIANRYRVLGNEPAEIPDALMFDLSHILVDIYGENYVGHSRMKTLLELNGRKNRDFLTGAEEAKAFAQGEYSRISKSTQRKTHEFEIIANKAREKSLKTENSLYKQYGLWLRIQLVIEDVHSHWLFKLFVVASVIYSSLNILALLLNSLPGG